MFNGNWRINMIEDGKKYDAMIKACNLTKEEFIETGQIKGFMGIYNLGLETEKRLAVPLALADG